LKTLSVEIERRQTLTFFVNVPDHWSKAQTRKAMTHSVIEETIDNTDEYDWNSEETHFTIAALDEMTDADADQIDYTFPDEPAPPHPDQLALIPAQEVAP